MSHHAPTTPSKDVDGLRRSNRARKPPKRQEESPGDCKHAQVHHWARAGPNRAPRPPFTPSSSERLSLAPEGTETGGASKKSRTVSPVTPSTVASRFSTRPTRPPAKVCRAINATAEKKKRASSFKLPVAPKRRKLKPPPQKGALQNLTQEMMRYIQEAPNQVLRVPIAAEDLGVQKRRIYDVLHVMEGAGLVEPFNNGHGKNQNDYRWIRDMNCIPEKRPAMDKSRVSALQAEEAQLDMWIDMLRGEITEQLNPDPQERYDRSLYVNSVQLKRHLFHHHRMDNPRQFVAVALKQDDVVQEVDTRLTAAPDHHQLMIRPPTSEPWDWADVPEGFKIKGLNQPLSYLAFAPPPPTLGQFVEGMPSQLGTLGMPCTSDFSATALMGLASTSTAHRSTSLGTWSSKEEEQHESHWEDGKEEQDLGLIPLLLRASTSLCWIEA